MKALRAMHIAFSTYSRVPLPPRAWDEAAAPFALCFFPFIGLTLGLAGALWLALARAWGLSPAIVGAVGALLPLFVVGGIHLDGFMDTCDARASCQSRERRLQILKDSHVGAFAVMGCCGNLLLRAALMPSVPPAAVVPVFVVSRALSALCCASLPPARAEGMLASLLGTGSRGAIRGSAGLFLAASALFWALCLGVRALLPLAAAALAALWFARMARRDFGGISGDLAGYLLEIEECAMLLMLAILA